MIDPPLDSPEPDSSHDAAPVPECGGSRDPAADPDAAPAHSTEPTASDSPLLLLPAVAWPEVVLLRPYGPPVWLPVTIVYSLLAAALLALTLLSAALGDRADNLKEPERFLEHVMGRNLDAEEYRDYLPAWERLLNSLVEDKPGEALEQAIEAYQDYTGKKQDVEEPKQDMELPSRQDSRLHHTLAVMLAEAGRLDEAEAELESLAEDSAEDDFIAAVRFAYWPEDSELAPPRQSEGVAVLSQPWSHDRLELRIAEARTDAAGAAAARERLVARGKRLHDQSAPLTIGPVVVMAAGLLVLVGWCLCRCPTPQVGDGLTQAPWSFGRGCAVLVRGAALGLATGFALSVAAALVDWLQPSIPADRLPGVAFVAGYFDVLHGFGTLLASLPLLAFAWWHLLGPRALSLRSCFGLRVPVRRWGGLLLFTLALAAIDFMGSTAINGLTSRLGFHSHWAESPLEDYLWKPWWVVGLDSLDGVLWAPIFEEIGFRGLVYTTIRRRLPSFPAAFVTGLIFGAVHGYTLPGFLEVSWGGFVWSLAYEKSRSLLPGMICHSINNILAFGGMVLMYRL